MQDSPQLALEHVRQLVERNRRDCAAGDLIGQAKEVHSVGVVGAGIMGSAIAAAHAKMLIPVVVIDNDPKALERAEQAIVAELADGPFGRQAERLTRHLIRTTSSLDDLSACDLVVESIVERTLSKQGLYAQLEPRLRPGAILASNTSTIPIGRLAAGLADPERFCGLHFCHPVRHRPLVEVVRGPDTCEETIAAAIGHSRRLGMMPVVVQDGAGFVINRLLMAHVSEAMSTIMSGIAPSDIDEAMVGFGMAAGPLEILDEIGLDTALFGAVIASEVAGVRNGMGLLIGLVKERQLGRKSGAGFYVYPGRHVNPLAARLAEERTQPPTRGEDGSGSIPQRLLVPMVREAERILQEGRASEAGHIDLATVFGLGFPVHKGGLLWWASHAGLTS